MLSLAPGGDEPVAEQGSSPFLTLDGFTGPLDHLLTLARAQSVDLASLSLSAILDQLATASRQAPATMPLGQKGDWVVMAAWLVQLRTRLLLPADAPARQEAAAEADQLHTRLVSLQNTKTLTAWLSQRLQLGHDVFARGQPEVFGVSADAAPAVDIIAFLWASLALFDADPVADTTTVYQPEPFDLYPVAEARERILRVLGTMPDGASLETLLPDAESTTPPASRPASQVALRRRSGWSSTFVASLELAKQGAVVLGQGGDFQPIHVAQA
jgi:segregation and condensation protein A